ncbi:MAG: hypothetical protein ACLR0U_03525 [Enterocloster clostridioformis]
MEALLDSHALWFARVHPFQYKLGDRGNAGAHRLPIWPAWVRKRPEVYHSSHNRLESAKLQEMAARHHLLPTGGSDFHGSNKPDISIGQDGAACGSPPCC